MSNIPDILKVIDGEYDEWVPVKQIADDAMIADGVQTVYVDTRDFAIGWNFKQPESFKKAECGLEVRANEGLARVKRIKQSKAIGDYLISRSEIIPWLKKLCEKSGGFDIDWRMLAANLEGCHGWDIKYIRFIKHTDGRFFVCNAYWWPVKWGKILDNLQKPY